MEENQNEVHYGQEIKKKFDESGMTVVEFSNRIYRSRNAVYSIFNRQYVDDYAYWSF